MSTTTSRRTPRKTTDGHKPTASPKPSAPAKPAPAKMPQSAAAPSPFTPIADYAFLSDCHTGALIAPDGSVEWMCVPRFDSPSVFGSLLDRRGGSFRVGPYGIVVPLSVRYIPGTMVLETTWMCPSGWIVVRDVMTIGPWHNRRSDVTTHTRPQTDQDAEHVLASYRHMLKDHPLRDIRYYWDNHMCASFMVDGLGLDQIGEIGIDKVMWSSDYPHNESTFGYSERSRAAVVDAVGPEDAVRVVGGNIRNFLGI